MASVPEPIAASPAQDFQPYDAAAGPGMVGGWEKLPGGPCDTSTGQMTGEDFESSGPWRQC